MRRVAAVVCLSIGLLGGPACRQEKSAERASATFGVLFGGQIQERREIPFELDSTRQTLGFRVDLPSALQVDSPVEWQIARPRVRRAEKRRGVDPSQEESAPEERGRGILRAGEQRFEQTISLHPGDPLGLWNIRVVVSGLVVIDRPFEVYDAAARERARRNDGG